MNSYPVQLERYNDPTHSGRLLLCPGLPGVSYNENSKALLA